MNYLKIYEDIISNAKSKEKHRMELKKSKKEYFEKHHIIPKCLGGTNDKDNLVLLTAKEHFICHRILVLINPGNEKLIRALFLMSHTNKKQGGRYIPSGKIYERIREEWSIVARSVKRSKENIDKTSGTLNGMFGKIWIKRDNIEKCVHKNILHKYIDDGWIKGRIISDEQKRKFSLIAKSRSPMSEETKKKLSDKSKGHVKSDIERAKRSTSLKGRIPWNKGIKNYKNLTVEEKNSIKNSHNLPESI
jgi:hypothetical protein